MSEIAFLWVALNELLTQPLARPSRPPPPVRERSVDTPAGPSSEGGPDQVLD